jgi:pimeloyl-ACP methyl ester carboxylesterase
MPLLDHDGVSLAYDEVGPEDGPPVVLLHGLTGARTTWHELAQDLARDHRVYALDHRGHGDSGRAPGTYDVAHWAGDAIALLEEVVGGPAVLVGHSLGGVVAAHLAGLRPDLVRGLFLEDPPLFLGLPGELESTPFGFIFPLMLAQSREMHDRGAPLEEYLEATAAVPSLTGTTMLEVLGPAGLRRSAEAARDLDPEALAQATVEGDGLAVLEPTRALSVPIHLLRAEPDLVAAFRPQDEGPFLAANPHAVVELVPGASHLIHDEQPRLVLARIRAFLDQLGA